MDLIANIMLLAATVDPSPLGVDWATVGHWTSVVLKVILGLGAVIFVHELGHFLVAKACGVRCDKFYVGFDVPLGRLLNWLIGRAGEMKLFGFSIPRTIGPRVKWGETEYGIGILPLGGYVKMLGQDDDPAHVAEQMQKSQVDAANANGVEVVGPNGEKYFVDRRSYVAKSVPQRMAIISAGVIMNIIFAFIFAVIAFGMGVPFVPSIVSETVPGSPAWKAGIEPGDEIIQFGDRINPSFNQLRGGVTLGDMENGIPTVVRRAADGKVETINLKPEQTTGLAKVGIAPAYSLTLFDELPVAKDTPAARAKIVGAADEGAEKPVSKFEGGDQIIRINDVAVGDYRELAIQLARHAGEPLRVTVLRAEKPADGSARDDADAPKQELTFDVPARSARSLGVVMQMGPISAIQENSPAESAGLKVGDVIEAVNGQTLDGTDGWDPATLPERLQQAAEAGEKVVFTVRRAAKVNVETGSADAESSKAEGERLEIAVTPQMPITYHATISPGAPMGIPSLGVAYAIENQVQAIAPDGPAAKAAIEPGDRVMAAKFIFPKGDDETAPEPPLTVKLVADKPGWFATLIGRLFGAEGIDSPPADLPNWPFVFSQLQLTRPGTKVELSVTRGDSSAVETVEIEPVAASGLYVAERGFNLKPVERIRKAETFAQQVQFGWDETVESLTMVYRFLQKIGTQVPITALGGPVTIAKAAGYHASAGIPTFLVFLTMLSANLAVVNFLPIPLLDGGHMVFLAYEGLRGRPANEKVVGALHMAGFVFIVSLMLFVLALDFNLIDRNL